MVKMRTGDSAAPDLDINGAYGVGGISALALGICYIIITVLYVLGGALPDGTEAWLNHLASHTNEWWIILGLSVFTDFLFLPVAWALYTALKGFNKTIALGGAMLLALFVVLDLAVTWTNYASLIHLSGKYIAASDIQRPAVVTAADYAYEVLSSPLFGVYTILVPALGILLFGIVMRRGSFSGVPAWLGIATGVAGVISVAGPFFVPDLGMVAVLTSVLTLVWLLWVGVRLVRPAKAKSAY